MENSQNRGERIERSGDVQRNPHFDADGHPHGTALRITPARPLRVAFHVLSSEPRPSLTGSSARLRRSRPPSTAPGALSGLSTENLGCGVRLQGAARALRGQGDEPQADVRPSREKSQSPPSSTGPGRPARARGWIGGRRWGSDIRRSRRNCGRGECPAN
jgi:hypothetical protein